MITIQTALSLTHWLFRVVPVSIQMVLNNNCSSCGQIGLVGPIRRSGISGNFLCSFLAGHRGHQRNKNVQKIYIHYRAQYPQFQRQWGDGQGAPLLQVSLSLNQSGGLNRVEVGPWDVVLIHPLIEREVLTMVYHSFVRGCTWRSTVHNVRSCCSVGVCWVSASFQNWDQNSGRREYFSSVVSVIVLDVYLSES